MFSFFSKKDKSSTEPSEQFLKLRNSILMSSASQYNIQSSGKNPDVWGVLIDENFGKHIQSVWITAGGQLSVFQFAGENKMSDDPRMADLLRHLIFHAEACFSSLTPTTTCPLPVSGNIRFSIFTFTGLYTSEVEVRELAISKGNHALANLHNSYHNILFLNKWGKLQFPIGTSFFKPCATGEPTKIYARPDLNSTPIIELEPGSQLELGVVKDADGMKWITATLPSGQWGYMRGDTMIKFTMHMKLFDREVTVYSEPSKDSAVVTHMKKNTIYDVIPFGNHDQNWARIRDSYGNEGYIDGMSRGEKLNA
jgi:SH3 domain-containing protein